MFLSGFRCFHMILFLKGIYKRLPINKIFECGLVPFSSCSFYFGVVLPFKKIISFPI